MGTVKTKKIMQIRRKINVIMLGAVAAFVLSSCKPSQGKIDLLVEDVFCQPICFGDSILGAPSALALSDSILAIVDTQSDSLIHIVNVEKQKYIRKVGVLGQGPTEFTMITSLNTSGNGSFGLYDPNKRTFYNMACRIDTVSFSPLFRIDSLMHYEVRPLANRLYLTTGIYEANRYCLVNSQGKIEKTFGEWPYRDEKEKNVSGRVKAQAYMGGITVNPSGTKFLSYVATADILSFYQLEKGEAHLVKESCLTYLDYAYSDNSNSFRGTSREAPLTYLAATSTEKYVYLLYSGKNTGKYNLSAFSGNIIYVYTWDGDKVAELKSDKDLQCLCVSPDGKVIYTIANTPEPTLVQISLPRL